MTRRTLRILHLVLAITVYAVLAAEYVVLAVVAR